LRAFLDKLKGRALIALPRQHNDGYALRLRFCRVECLETKAVREGQIQQHGVNTSSAQALKSGCQRVHNLQIEELVGSLGERFLDQPRVPGIVFDQQHLDSLRIHGFWLAAG